MIKENTWFDLIIGRINIEVEALQIPDGVDYVEFYIDDELVSTDESEPYEYTWKRCNLLQFHIIKVIAYANSGKSSYDTEKVFRIL